MKEEEYNKLCKKYDKSFVDDLIEKMDNWCISKGKVYKDYYRAFLNWAKNDFNKSGKIKINNGYREIAVRIIQALNKNTRVNRDKLQAFPFHDLPVYDYKDEEILKFPIRLLQQGKTEKDCIRVIEIMCSRWEVNGKMREFLRPSTLFNPEKFAGYLLKEKQNWYTEDDGETWKLEE